MFGLSRSRTYWLSRFLSYGDWHCGHDESRHMGTLDDVRAWLSQPCTGTVETAAAPWWRLALHYRPDLKIVTVRRPIAEIVASAARVGWTVDPAKLRRRSAKLDQIEARVPGVMKLSYADLAREDVCAAVFQHCLPYAADHDWWASLSRQNLQVNPRALDRYVTAYRKRLTALEGAAKQASMAALFAVSPRSLDGFVFQQEPLDRCLTDGAALFAAHSAAIGEEPDSYKRKNIPLMRKLEQIGALMITTARCNGRMFGYLMAIVSPSLQSPDLTSGLHTLFYASPEVPGLGLKLQRHSIAAMAERGVGEAIFRAGVRGSGDRTSVLYRRLGARPAGELFRLDMKEHHAWA